MDSSPFDQEPLKSRGVNRVQLSLVAQIGFTESSADGKLRHRRSLGLRADNEPRDVVREKLASSAGKSSREGFDTALT